jgi:arylsulfatase A-like enzyme
MSCISRVPILFLILSTGFISACTDHPASIPNIIFILTDDQRWDALGYAGNPIIQTPHMDELAKSGLYFQNAFVTTPICPASRASILAGLYERTHDYNFGKPELRNEYMLESYPYLLRQAGYRTGFVGKFGIQVNKGIEDSLFHEITKTTYPYLKEVDGQKIHLADIHGDHAIDFIRENKAAPFCLSLSFWSPHAEDHTEEQYFWADYVDSLYREDTIPTPPTADPDFFAALPEFLQTSMNRKRWYWRYDTPEKRQRMVKGYYRMISTVDRVIGRIQNALEEEGLADNTVVILMGDNGYFLGERGYAGKWTLHEPSLRVPLILYDPRQPAANRGRILPQVALNIDVAPTILDLAGLDIPDHYHGSSLAAFHQPTAPNWRSAFFAEHRREGDPLLLRTEGIRDENWKFIRYDDFPYVELYNHREDPDETINLALDPAYAPILQRYQSVCDSLVAKFLGDRVE